MENASRALIMAATVLMALLLLSVFVYVFQVGASVDQTYDEKQVTNQLNLFNSKFDVHQREDNNVIEAISIANLAYSINEDVLYDMAKSVEVVIKAGNKYFIIPTVEIENDNFKRNKILTLNNTNYTSSMVDDNIIYTYNLADKTLKDLGITGGIEMDKPSPTSTPEIDYENDKLSTTRLAGNKTIYKYYFSCECCCGNPEHKDVGLTYNTSNGRITRIEFEVKYNSEWNSSTAP